MIFEPGEPKPLADGLQAVVGGIQAVAHRFEHTDFRSSLEAHWAASLSGLGITWQYEPRTFTLPSGTTYVPDFYLPRLGTWIEVKGEGLPGLEQPRELAEVLACNCPSPGPCGCDWEGGQIILIGHAARFPPDCELRLGALAWSAARATAYLARCTKCGHWCWVQPRFSLRCRHCRACAPRNAQFAHLHGPGEIEFRHADHIPETLIEPPPQAWPPASW